MQIGEEEIKQKRISYEKTKSKYGEDSRSAIDDAISLALVLMEMRRGLEGQRVFERQLSVCRRVHGPDHQLTRRMS